MGWHWQKISAPRPDLNGASWLITAGDQMWAMNIMAIPHAIVPTMVTIMTLFSRIPHSHKLTIGLDKLFWLNAMDIALRRSQKPEALLSNQD